MVKYILNLVVHWATNARNVVAQCENLVAKNLHEKNVNTQPCLLKVIADESIVDDFRLVALFLQNIKLHVVSHWATETLTLVA